MQKFFSLISKHKKALSFIFLGLFVLVGFFGAGIKVAKADCYSDCLSAVGGSYGQAYSDCITNYNCANGGIYAPAANSGTSGSDNNGAAGTDADGDCQNSSFGILKGTVAGFADIFVWIARKIAELIIFVSSFTLSPDGVLHWPITKVQSGASGAAVAFASGWTSTRDLANMLVVLGFVIIGIAFALRIEGYGTKKALFNLIIVALLINFSGLFCGLIIDGSNLTMTGLLEAGSTSGTSGGVANMGEKFVSDIKRMDIESSCQIAHENKLMAYVLNDAQFILIYLVLAFSFLYLAVMLIARYAVLGILFILSPIAFVFWAFPFPKAKDLWNKWWAKFLSWSFMGVGICFFLNIANKTADGFTQLKSVTSATPVTNIVSYVFVVLAIMIVGIIITSKSSPIGAQAVMGLAKGAAGFAMGAVAGSAGLASRITQRATGGKYSLGGTAAQNVKNKFGKALEWAGIKDIGSTATANSEAVDKEAKGMAAAYAAAKASGDTATVERIQKMARQGTGRKGAAAMKVVAKDMDSTFKDPSTGKLNSNTANARIAYAESVGAIGLRDEAEKQNHQLAEYNDSRVNQALNAAGHSGAIDTELHAHGIDPTKATAAQRVTAAGTAAGVGAAAVASARDTAVMAQLKQNLPQMSTSQLGKIDESYVDTRARHSFVRENFAPHMIDQIAVSGNAGLISGLKGRVGSVGVADTLADDQDKAFRAGNMGEFNRLQKLIDAINKLP